MKRISATNTYMRMETSSGRVVTTYEKGRIQKVDVQSKDYEKNIVSVQISLDDTQYSWESEKIYLVGYMMYGIPVSKDGRFLFAQQDMRGLYCLDAKTGDIVWKTKSRAEVEHVLVRSQHLCCSKSRNEIQLIDIETGEVLKSYKTPFDNRFEVLTDDLILNHTHSKSWELISSQTLEVVQRIPEEELRKFFENFYRPRENG